MDLGEYLKSINQTKVNLMRQSGDPKAVSDYPAYVVRRLLSYHLDAIFFINELNTRPVDPRMEYEYLLHVLPARRRFEKPEKKLVTEDVDLLKRFYNYSTRHAEEVLPLHSEEDLAMIRKRMAAGGVVTTASRRKKGKDKA